ncbi:MAG: ABC transporter permease [Ardenticatenaceae bacterium]|nr:ABC transporter permease [Ardenticatenaceae bacterium]MCB8986370.1 ABC transporter permease [Ardenticatenaceae bacterium]
MTPFLKYLLGRLIAIPITLLIITMVLYGIIMLAPPEERAALYLPPRLPSRLTASQIAFELEQIAEEHGMNDPYLVQYGNWLREWLSGYWGWSPILRSDVRPVLLARTAVTLELTFYSLLVFIPLGLISGVVAGWRPFSATDSLFRFAAFVGTSIPPFILGLFLLSIFYVGLRWFPPGRTSITGLTFRTSTFQAYTGFLTVDGVLNGRFDVTFNAFRHLVLPVFTLSLFHWATLGRINRALTIEEKDKDYVLLARSRGLRHRSIVWRHTFRNTISPALTSTALSAASIITGVYVIEVIFGLKGLSELIAQGIVGAPDAPLTLAFSVYSVLLVIPIMVALDIIKAIVDPRDRLATEEVDY